MTCTECATPIRPRKSKLADHPGTKEHAGRGLCSACHSRERYIRRAMAEGREPGKRRTPERVREDFSPTFATSALNYWIADRNKRLGVSA
jgi:hypothetical protein